MDKPTSFSQNNVFNNCSRWWFLQYIKKVPTVQDMCYADAGTVLHSTLQKYYSNEIKDLNDLKAFFNKEWNSKNLPATKLRFKQDSYWVMALNGIELNKNLGSTEFKIYFPDVVGYIDGLSTSEDELIDWKSSTRSPENEEEYKLQLQFYSYLYQRKFSRLPKKATVYYLKYNGSKGELTFNPTDEDVKKAETWHIETRSKMKELIDKNICPPKCAQCHFFCPYKDYCDENDKEHLNFKIHIMGSHLVIEGNISPLLEKGLNKKFSYELKNSYWIKKHNPNINTMVRFWNPKNRTLPIGFIYGLGKTLKDYTAFKKVGLNLEIKDHRIFDETKVLMPDKFVNGKELRDYQKEAVETFLNKKIGVLEICTGGGKTLIAAEIIRRLGYKTLFVVDKIELLRQTKQVLEEALGIEIGQIGAGESNIKDVTIATIQTLSKNLHLYSQYLQTIRLSIVDECHKLSADSYIKLSKHLTTTEFRLSISGTARRDDGNDMKITSVGGYHIYNLGSTQLIQQGWLMKPKIQFIDDYMTSEDIDKLEENTKTCLINETESYSKYYNNFIVYNSYRNKHIKTLCEGHKKKVLILVKLIEHGKLLEDQIEGSKYLYGETNKEDRATIFKDFVEGRLKTLISTISIFAEGIDIPSLDMVINASGNKGDVKTIQVLGRVLRKLEGKTEAFYIDFMDPSNFFHQSALSRRRALMKEGHEIEVIHKQ